MKNLNALLLLCLIAVVGVFTLDVYLPGVPAMAKDLDVSINQIAFTFTGFSFVFALMQLMYGSLSDRFGRKPVLLTGLIIAGLASLVCIYATHYWVLFAARLCQAMGISVFVVLNAIIRDLYTGVKAIQVRTFVGTVSGVSLSIAPTIGGFLQNQFNWQAAFMASLLLILLTFFYALLFFKETQIKNESISFSISSLRQSYIEIFSAPSYFKYVLVVTLAFTVHFAFIVSSAKIFINLLGFTPLTFGYLMLMYGGVYFINGILVACIAKKVSASFLLQCGGVFIALGGLMMLTLISFTSLKAWQIMVPMMFATFGITLLRPTGTTCALALISTKAGQGAAGLNLIQFMLSSLLVTGMTELPIASPFALALLILMCAVPIIMLNNRVWFQRSILITE